MFLCERRFSPLSFLSGNGNGSNRPSTPSASASAYGDFEDSLRHRLHSLLPPPPSPANECAPLAYLSRAVGVLASTHAEAARLLRLHPTADIDPAALSSYLDTSAGVLELCNAASAKVDGLLRRRLLLVYALRLLADAGGGARGGRSGTWRIDKVRKAIADWETGEEEGREDLGLGSGYSLYRDAAVIGAVKSSGKEHTYSGAGHQISAFGRAVFAVEAVFGLVRSILLTFLCPAGVNPAPVDLGMPGVPDGFAWAGVYKELQTSITARSERGDPMVLEMEAVKSRAKELVDTVSNSGTSSSGSAASVAVRELENAVDDLTRGMEGLAKAVTGLFRSALRARDAAVESLRAGRMEGKL